MFMASDPLPEPSTPVGRGMQESSAVSDNASDDWVEQLTVTFDTAEGTKSKTGWFAAFFVFKVFEKV